MTTQTLAITDFLLARIAEDEAHYRRWSRNWRWTRAGRRYGRDAARDCAEQCAAVSRMDYEALRFYAAIYADHDDYRPEWRP